MSMKVHNHSEQFDGHWHAVCHKGTTAVSHRVFEATPSDKRCFYCEKDWFRNGQPLEHLSYSQKKLEEEIQRM